MKIYNKNGVEILDVKVSDESYRFRSIMAVPVLTLYFSLNTFTEIPVDSYCDFQAERFYLFDPVNFKKNSSEKYEYTLIMHGIAEKLRRFKFYDFVNGGLIFSLTAKPADHIAMLINVLNEKDSGWTAGTVIDSKEISVNYNHNFCMDALGMICDAAETEFEITPEKVIHIRKTEYNKATPLALAYGPGNGIKPGIERKNDNNGRPIEKLYVQGGERNIDFSVYGSRYLLLPDSQILVYNGRSYQVDADGLYIQRTDVALSTGQEESLDASTIYPSRVNVVTDVEIIDLQRNLYNVIDDTIPADLNYEENIIAGQTMSIVFQTGILAGKEFEVNYIHEFNRFEIIPKEFDGIMMPSGSFIPVASPVPDTFVVFGCSFPPAYIRDDETETGASWDMFREAVAYMQQYEDEKYSYAGPVSPIWLKDGWETISPKLILGGYCSLTDPELGGVLIRIRSIKDYVNNHYDVEIDMSNALVKASFNTTLAKLGNYTSTYEELIRNYYETLIEGGDINEILRILKLNGFVDTQTKLLSGAVVWQSGMTYETTDFLYLILGTRYECAATTVTLEASDPGNPRIDVFYLDTFGNINVRTGTPSANPVEPTLGELECYVTSVYIGAGATEPSYLSQEMIYDEKVAGEWTPTAYADAGLTSINLEAIAEPATGNKHIGIAINVPDEVLSQPLHYIGEKYQGGIIFMLEHGGTKGLIAAEFDTVTDVQWSTLKHKSPYTTGATSKAIGAGQANTTLMLANNAANNYAAKYAANLVIDGYSDWFIGSLYEMQLLFFRRFDVGNFNPSKIYWTSTEHDWNDAWAINFDNGGIGPNLKNRQRNVRAIRAFDDSNIPASGPVESYVPEDTAIVFQAPEPVLAAEGILSFRMKTSAEWLKNSILWVEMYNGAARVGSCAVSPATSLFGFNAGNTSDYQLVAIFHANFSLSQNWFDGLKISLKGSWPNGIDLLIDSIRFQHTTALQPREKGAMLQIQDQVLLESKWEAYFDYFRYTYTNTNITDLTSVDVIPWNEDLELVTEAVFYPETYSSKGQVVIYARYIPTNDIRVTINIKQTTL